MRFIRSNEPVQTRLRGKLRAWRAAARLRAQDAWLAALPQEYVVEQFRQIADRLDAETIAAARSGQGLAHVEVTVDWGAR